VKRADALKEQVSNHMNSTCLWRPPADSTPFISFLPFPSCFSLGSLTGGRKARLVVTGTQWAVHSLDTHISLAPLLTSHTSLVSDQEYLDLSGVRLPIGLTSLDRLDPDGNYTIGNLRVLFTPFNLIRSAARNDLSISRYLEQISPDAGRRGKGLETEVSVACLHLSIRAWA
jgi:hypothetical protein